MAAHVSLAALQITLEALLSKQFRCQHGNYKQLTNKPLRQQSCSEVGASRFRKPLIHVPQEYENSGPTAKLATTVYYTNHIHKSSIR